MNEGLSYFPLKCALDERLELVEAEYGLKGFAVVVKLLQKIYGENGYYCEWSSNKALLFAKQCGFSDCGGAGSLGCDEQSGRPKNLIDHVINASIKRGIFDKTLYEKYGILTSREIQENFLRIVRNRKSVKVEGAYLLLSDAEIKENVVKTETAYVRNGDSDVRFGQSKVNNKRKVNKNSLCKADALALFEHLWSLYPVKKGKGQVSDTQKMKLLKTGREEMERAIQRYVAYVDSIDFLHYKNGSTFFNSGYVDYLDANYAPDSEKQEKKASGSRDNPFNQFQQNEYDFDELLEKVKIN